MDIRRVGAGLVLSIVGFVGAACSPTEGGEAVPSSPQSGTPTSTSSMPGDNTPQTSLADIAPCSLLSTQELAKLGNFPNPTPDDTGAGQSCDYQKQREGTTDASLALSVDIHSEEGIDQINDMGEGINRTEANGRQLAQVPGPGGCMVSIGVTQTSRVDVIATGVEPTDRLCNTADEVAVIVEPKLPRS